MFVYGKKIQDIKKSVVKTLMNFFLIVETETHSKPFIKIIGILLLIVRFVRNSDHIRKKKKNSNVFN